MGQPDWFVIELSDYGNTASYPEIATALQSVFGSDVEYFIPIFYEQLGSYTSTFVLIEGYVFVKDSEAVRSRMLNLKENRIFSGFLRQCGKDQKVDSNTIRELKRKLKKNSFKKFNEGMKVRVMEGVLQNLEGEIVSIENNGRIANVKISCFSREIIAPVPTTCIEGL